MFRRVLLLNKSAAASCLAARTGLFIKESSLSVASSCNKYSTYKASSRPANDQQEKEKLVNVKGLFGLLKGKEEAPKTVVTIEYDRDTLDVKKANEIVKTVLSSTHQAYEDVTKNKKIEDVCDYLLENVSTLATQEIFDLARLILKFYKNKFINVKRYLDENIEQLTADQLVLLALDFRTSKVLDLTEFSNYKNSLRDRLQEIVEFDSALCVLKLFYLDKSVVEIMNNSILQMSDSLTRANWLNLLNTKSILRQREPPMLVALCYHLAKYNDKFKLEEIKQCFLSFGVLSFYEETLFKRLLNDLSQLVSTAKDGGELLNDNQFNIILMSIGMLQLRDEQLIDNICAYLRKNKKQHSKMLLLSFLVSCANVNYKPAGLNEIIEVFDTSDIFDFNDAKQTMQFLNLTWSLCVFDSHNVKFIKTVLMENFWKKMISDQNSKNFMPNLIKLLHINLYALTVINNYDGPTLPADVNIIEYQDLIDVRSTNPVSQALTNFVPKDKCFKSSLMMPYGIFVDAFMITTKRGEIKPLDSFFNEETNEFDADSTLYNKLAFKYLDFKDMTAVTNKVNGRSKMQINILKALGYLVIPVSYIEYAKEPTPLNKVKLLQDKISLYSKNPKYVAEYLK